MKRLDIALVEGRLCASREKAQRAIMAGLVTINGQPARKPGLSVKEGDRLSVAAGEKYVSRGGQKLEHALDHFGLDVRRQTAIDLGASTGGFTDCLLQRGAARVYAVDVGQGQLAWKLRNDARVIVMEQTNARDLTPARFAELGRRAEATRQAQRRRGEREKGSGGEFPPARFPPGSPAPSPPCTLSPLHPFSPAPPFTPVDLVVIDCSFISLRKILPAAVALLRPLGNIVALIKPQFEAGKAEADKGAGVITDPVIHERVLCEIREFAGSLPGLKWGGVTESPLLGPAGNKEFLALIEKAG